MRTDPALIKAIRDHTDHEAWRTFEARYAPIIVAYCVSRGLDRVRAEDVSQEAFLRICKHGFADRYDPEQGTFRSYLFRVIRSIASKSSIRPGIQDDHQHPAEDPDEAWDRAWREHAVRLAIRRVEPRLSPRAGEILSLSLRGVSPLAISEITGMSRDAVYKSRERVRREIEAAYRELDLEAHDI